MPAASSIYWNSQDSQMSSGESSEPRSCTSGADRRRYVDPWDLENYAYLRRRHNQLITLHRTDDHGINTHNLSPQLRTESNTDSHYWYPVHMPVMREPVGYVTATTIEKLYLQRPSRQMHHVNPYPVQQPSYEDEARYVTPNPVYVPLSDLESSAGPVELEESRLNSARRNRPIKNTPRDKVEACPCPYHGPLTNTSAPREVRVTPPKQLGLNTYGHLRIDYTKSWNSLHRKMKK